MGKWKASITIVKQSWALLLEDKEIMWFPVLSSLTGLLALIVMATGYFFLSLGGDWSSFQEGSESQMNADSYALLFVYYLVMMFIVNFFETGIYIIVHARFNGGDLNFRDGINGAIENSWKIFIWSCISATVGVVLRAISDRSKLIGKIVAMLLGAAWTILTYFSLPALIIGKKGIVDSFKESASLIRRTWGEAIIINLGVGLFFSGLFFLLFALCIGIAILVPSFTVIIGLIIFFVIAIIVLSVISSALSSIFKLALYEYATTGRVPNGFSAELVQHAVKPK